MKSFHHGQDDFRIWAQDELLEKQKQLSEAFKIALGSIAIVALLVGGIGIMNVLLASVNERIKEIGIRKAVGASPTDVTLQFLFESMLLTVSGGIVGVLLGMTMSKYVVKLLATSLPQRGYEWTAVTTPQSIIIALIFAIGTGFIFRLYPALKASRLDPCEALGYQ